MNEAPDFNEEAGSFLRVDLTDGTWFAIKSHEESVVRQAVIAYRERRLDSLVELEARQGHTVSVVASMIAYFQPCTPEIRRNNILDEIRQDEWEERFRREHAAKPWDG